MTASLDNTVTDVVDKNSTPAPTAASNGVHLTAAQLARQDGDIDMIAACRDILVANGIPAEGLAVYDSSASLNNAKSLTTAAQRIALNQYWHLQMGPFGRLTHQQRYKLIEDGTVEDWLKLFTQGPVQFIIDNNLPVTL